MTTEEFRQFVKELLEGHGKFIVDEGLVLSPDECIIIVSAETKYRLSDEAKGLVKVYPIEVHFRITPTEAHLNQALEGCVIRVTGLVEHPDFEMGTTLTRPEIGGGSEGFFNGLDLDAYQLSLEC